MAIKVAPVLYFFSYVATGMGLESIVGMEDPAWFMFAGVVFATIFKIEVN